MNHRVDGYVVIYSQIIKLNHFCSISHYEFPGKTHNLFGVPVSHFIKISVINKAGDEN
jgi:hypothetical protein